MAAVLLRGPHSCDHHHSRCWPWEHSPQAFTDLPILPSGFYIWRVTSLLIYIQPTEGRNQSEKLPSGDIIPPKVGLVLPWSSEILRIYVFYEVALEKVKSVLVWQFTGRQMEIVQSYWEELLYSQHFLGGWMCGMKTQQPRASHLMELQLAKGQWPKTRHVWSSTL